jgi:uncharacterized protein (DUF4415 family)
MSTTNKKKIKYGKKNALTSNDFKNPKVRITMMVDEETLRAFKAKAQETGEGYQTLMNRVLKEATTQPSLEERVLKLEMLMKAS